MRSDLQLACAHGLKKKQLEAAKDEIRNRFGTEKEFEFNGHLYVCGAGKFLPGGQGVSQAKYTTAAAIANLIDELGIEAKDAEIAWRRVCAARNRDKQDGDTQTAQMVKAVIEEQPATPIKGKLEMAVEFKQLTRMQALKEAGKAKRKAG